MTMAHQEQASKNFYRKLGRRNALYKALPWLAEWREGRRLVQEMRGWRTAGLPTPAPHPLKRALLIQEGKRIQADTLVETGTYTGDTVWFCRPAFRHIYSIEVQPDLAAAAKQRFAGDPGVHIECGDSPSVLPGILANSTGRVLFWLDGHYSGGPTGKGAASCPIFDELAAIAGAKPSVFSIVIDDLRLFGTDDAYPPLSEVRAVISRSFPELGWSTYLDMIWCPWIAASSAERPAR